MDKSELRHAFGQVHGKLAAISILLSYHLDFLPDDSLRDYVKFVESFKSRILDTYSDHDDDIQVFVSASVEAIDDLVGSLRDIEEKQTRTTSWSTPWRLPKALRGG